MPSPRGHTTTAGFGCGGGGWRVGKEWEQTPKSPHLQIQADERKMILVCVIINHVLNEFHIRPTVVKIILKI